MDRVLLVGLTAFAPSFPLISIYFLFINFIHTVCMLVIE
nr:MAG TPA: hypothetical protein [Caudoviricetes sp.]